jgi:hypothetical protein
MAKRRKEGLMNSGRIVFAQLMDFLPRYEFQRCVQRYSGNHRVRTFTCYDQLLSMAFAQLTGRESLRDTVTCLRAMRPKLYHAGLRGAIARSTLSDANELRDWRIYADFAQVLIRKARTLYADDAFGVALQQTAYAFDSTTIDLCLQLFPWARFRRHKGGVKMHTLIDLRGNIPCFVHITDALTHDVKALDELPLEPGAFYVMDRAYTDFERLYRFTRNASFFITRAKRNLDFVWRASHPIDKSTGLRSDQTIALCGPKTSRLYPNPLRRITYIDATTGRRFIFLTNNFWLPAFLIEELYHCRWQIELFFKWIKQHLHIKAFYGTSENAVKTQIWIAVCVFVLVAIVKRELHIDRSLSEILNILSITLFENTPIILALNTIDGASEKAAIDNQLNLFKS